MDMSGDFSLVDDGFFLDLQSEAPGDAQDDLWLDMPLFVADFPVPSTVSSSTPPARPKSVDMKSSPLLSLPSTLLTKCLEYLEYWEFSALRSTGITQFIDPLTRAWGKMFVNTWERLDAPSEAFSCGRMRSQNMISSIEQMRRGVPAKLIGHDFAAFQHQQDDELHNSTPLKMRRLERPSTPQHDKELLVASYISAIFGSFSSLEPLIAPAMRELSQAAPSQGAERVRALLWVLERAKKALKRYRSKVVIPASHLRVLRECEEQIDRNVVQLDVLTKGWTYQQTRNGSLPVAIALHKQLYGGLFRPGQATHFSCQILTAPCLASDLVQLSPCSVTAVDVDNASLRTTDCFTTKPVASGARGLVDMKDFKFSKPTRQKLVRLEFDVSVTLADGTQHKVVSPPTYPLLVYSHQKQWSASYWNVFDHLAFGNRKGECSWPYFVNCFQELMCHQILSPPSNACPVVAALSSTDWDFIAAKFFQRRSHVARKDASEFADFITPFLFSLQFSRDYIHLWEAGYIAGFLPRESVNLERYGPGAFLLRYSTNVPGELVISFVSPKGDSTKHYLIREGDVSPKTRQSLAVFLWKSATLVKMLRCKVINDENSVVEFISTPKETVLKDWLSKGDIPEPTPIGYEQAH